MTFLSSIWFISYADMESSITTIMTKSSLVTNTNIFNDIDRVCMDSMKTTSPMIKIHICVQLVQTLFFNDIKT